MLKIRHGSIAFSGEISLGNNRTHYSNLAFFYSSRAAYQQAGEQGIAFTWPFKTIPNALQEKPSFCTAAAKFRADFFRLF